MRGKRLVRGNALTTEMRDHLINFMCYEDDYSQTEWSADKKKSEEERLKKLNNAKFRAEFIERYGEEWWDDMLRSHFDPAAV
jgi:hypothetical protein